MRSDTKIHWTGRETDPTLGAQYWHQAVQVIHPFDLNKITSLELPAIAIIGYACDEGVRRNMGRVGASQGPAMIRERLAKLAYHAYDKKIYDLGDQICKDEDMEACQKGFSHCISACIRKGIFTIGLGGGHDMAYGHFMGIYEALKDQKNRSIGIVNFDAHFDLRPTEEIGNSGTPFNQILTDMSQLGQMVKYLPIGIQTPSNTKELFDIAEKKGVDFISISECDDTQEKVSALQKKLSAFIETHDYLYVSIDLDGFSSAYAMGVSAPSPMGFTPQFILRAMSQLLLSKKIIACDIAELNPIYDQDHLTANLAARLIDFITSHT